MSLRLAWQRWLGLGALAVLPPLGLSGAVAWPFLLPLALVALAAVTYRTPLRPLPNWLENLLAPLILAAVAAAGGLRFGVVRPVAHLLVLLGAVRLLGGTEPSRRKTSLAVLALLAVAGIASSTHPALGVYLLGLLAGVVAAVMVLLPQELARARGTTAPPPGVSFRVLVATVLLASLVAVPLFVALPRLRSPFAAAGVGARPVSGFREAVALHQLGEIKASRRPMLRVRFETGGPVDPSWLRFAGATLTYYRAGRWLEPKRTAPKTSAWSPGRGDLGAEITLEQSSDRLFVPPGTTHLLPPSEVEPWQDGTEAWRIPRQLEPPIAYRVRFQPEAVHTKPPGPEDLAVGSNQEALALLAAMAVGEARDELGKAQALERYLQSRYRYTVTTNAPLGADPVEWFLFTSREGHCEFFASAMVLLLRTLGIPARLQTGFAGGQSLGEGEYLLRDANAHAWVLAYVQGAWRIFDPTPAEGRPALESAASRWDPRALWGQLEAFWDRWILTFSLADQLEMLAGLLRGARQWLPRGAAAALAVALVYALRRWTIRWRRQAPEVSPLGKLLFELGRAAGWEEAALRRATPSELLASLLPKLTASREACLALFQRHQLVVYGGAPPPSRRQLAAWSRAVLEELRRAGAAARTTSGRGPSSPKGRG